MASAALRALPDEQDDAIDRFAADREKPLLRFVTCGSVDDGKSTLIGRLLYDAQALFTDQLATLASDSRRFGTQHGALDFALLVDGLAAEREQGITIDVAYRHFASAARRFIVADSPGHEQYTRNMATAASTADMAILLIDATRGATAQTRRHARIVRLLGVREIVVAVNKMDLVGHDRARFDAIVAEVDAIARDVGIARFAAVPVVALTGDNIARRSVAMPWYRGPTLLDLLEQAPVGEREGGSFVMPVQRVSRPDADFRGFAGTIVRGAVRPGDRVVVQPGGRETTVARIVTFDGELAVADAGRAVTIELTDETECAAGAVLAAADDPPRSTRSFTADLIWFDDRPLALGARYLLQAGATRVPAHVESVGASAPLAMNDIATATLRTEAPLIAAPYAESRALGAFVLIDRETSATAAAGMIRALGDEGAHDASHRSPIYGFANGDPAAMRLVDRLRQGGTPVALLDRAALTAALGREDATSWRRIEGIATLMAGAGMTVVVAIDPPAGERRIGVAWADPEADAGSWVI